MNKLQLAQVYTSNQAKHYNSSPTFDSQTIGDAHLAGLEAVFKYGQSEGLTHEPTPPSEGIDPEIIAAEFEKRAIVSEKWGAQGQITATVFREVAKDIRSGKFIKEIQSDKT